MNQDSRGTVSWIWEFASPIFAAPGAACGMVPYLHFVTAGENRKGWSINRLGKITMKKEGAYHG